MVFKARKAFIAVSTTLVVLGSGAQTTSPTGAGAAAVSAPSAQSLAQVRQLLAHLAAFAVRAQGQGQGVLALRLDGAAEPAQFDQEVELARVSAGKLRAGGIGIGGQLARMLGRAEPGAACLPLW